MRSFDRWSECALERRVPRSFYKRLFPFVSLVFTNRIKKKKVKRGMLTDTSLIKSLRESHHFFNFDQVLIPCCQVLGMLAYDLVFLEQN